MIARGLAVAALVALLDQLSKASVLRFFGETGCAAHHREVTRFFDLVLTCNAGISFGLFNRSDLGSLVFAAAGAVIIVVLLFWLSRVRGNLMAVALGLVIGGAIGNVIDRLRFDGVIDFLYFHAGDVGLAGIQSCRRSDLSWGGGDFAGRHVDAARGAAGNPRGRCLAMIKHDRAVGGRTRAVALIGVCLSLLALPGCSDVRMAIGMDRGGPDEFAVESRAPLLIPPDFNLRPPQPGAATTE